MSDAHQVLSEVRSLLSSVDITLGKENKVRPALYVFQYLAQPEILEFFGNAPDYSNFRRVVLSKIAEFQKEPLIHQEPKFAQLFAVIQNTYSPRDWLQSGVALRLLCGLHPRLGSESPINCLDGFIVHQILEELC